MSESSKILYLHRTQAKGAEGSHIRGMVDGFRRLNYEVDIVGPPGVNPYIPRKSNQRHRTGPITKALSAFSNLAPEPCFEMAELVYNLLSKPAMSRQMAGKNYSFLYERYSLNSFVGATLSADRGMPHVLEVNDATVIERSRPLFFDNIARKIEKTVFDRATMLVTISSEFKNLIVSSHGIPPEKILVLPNAVDPASYDASDRLVVARRDLGIAENAIVVGCAGAFVQWHGLDFLVDALADKVKAEGLFLLFIGDGPVRPQIEQLALTKGIHRSVLFTGFVDAEAVPSFLEVLDICVIPDSNRHGSPMKLFEFMAMGKPVVIPAYAPLLETVTHGHDGLLFPPRRASSMIDAVMDLVASPHKRNELGINARNTIREKFTWDNHCVKVVEALHSLKRQKLQ